MAITYNNLGNMMAERGDVEAARAHFTRAHDLFVNLLGERHPYVGHALAGLAEADVLAGDDLAAIANHLAALEVMESSYGVEHLYLVQPLTGLGEALLRRGKVDEAAQHLARAVAIADEHGREDPLVARALEGLAKIAYREHDAARARVLYGRASVIYEATARGPGDLDAAARTRGLAAAAGEGSREGPGH
ncbi:MAG: tetratricopeptide repeat protein [Nannocystaceae bacterium]